MKARHSVFIAKGEEDNHWVKIFMNKKFTDCSSKTNVGINMGSLDRIEKLELDEFYVNHITCLFIYFIDFTRL